MGSSGVIIPSSWMSVARLLHLLQILFKDDPREPYLTLSPTMQQLLFQRTSYSQAQEVNTWKFQAG